MTGMPNAEIVEDSPNRMVYRDKGPWNHCPTITNRAEEFVAAVVGYGHLGKRRLFYIDSDGHTDEILIEDGKFAGFKLQNEDVTRPPMSGE